MKQLTAVNVLLHITFVESDNEVIVIDPLLTVETAKAAFDLYREHRGQRDVKAVIYTHSHADHYAGVEINIPGYH